MSVNCTECAFKLFTEFGNWVGVAGLSSLMDHTSDQCLRKDVQTSGRARHRFVYVLKPTSRARQESPMSTPIPKHRIPFHRDISH